MILYGQNLVNTLREHCDNVCKRLWIATPFIGQLREVEQIIGGRWRNADIDFRVLTDMESGFIKEDTFKEFNTFHPDNVCSLQSLHAKMFIVDDWCLLTSANLTGTAFSCRYEIGTEERNLDGVVKYFLSLWNHEDCFIMDEWEKGDEKNHVAYEDNKHTFKKKFNLPPYTSENEEKDKYLAKCSLFREFAKTYQDVTGRNQQMVADGFTLLQEVDFMFNFLYHHSRESRDIDSKSKLPGTMRSRIMSSFKKMSKFYDPEAEDVTRRIESTQVIQELTAPSRIMTLSKKEVQDILDRFNCLGLGSNSHGLRSRILSENKLRDILYNWDQLLNHGPITSDKVIKCQKAIHCFGDSSVSELIAWRYPDEYPIMNSCSINGLRYFGYDV